MKIKIFTVVVIIFTLFSSFSVNANLNNNDELLKNGRLEEYNGLKLLYVNGSYYEMGYQHGSLLKYEILENIRAFLNFSEKIGYSFDKLIYYWNLMKDFVPQEYIEEFQGIADGADVSFEKIAAIHTAFDCCNIFCCFGIAAWGDATQSKELIHMRSCDLPFTFKDPITGKYAHENKIILIRKPENGYASINPTVSGILNMGGGINEKKIGYEGLFSWSNDQSYNGIPIVILNQLILDQTSNIEEAQEFLTTNKTLGKNFIISDGKIPIGYAIEITSNLTYVGTWDNPVESNPPFRSIDNVVRRTNFFIDPDLAETQRNRYNPGGLIGLIKLFISAIKNYNDFYNPGFIFASWRNYKIMSREIEKKWGVLDLDNSITILRNVYNGKNDFLLKIIGKFGRSHGFLESWNQWTACPETGDMLVSFACRNKPAEQNPIYHFNLFKLINS